jgi:hypothetical protein
MLNWWPSQLIEQFSSQVSATVDSIERRVLPTFEDIDQEAEKVAERAWERFMSLPGTGDEDPGDFAEAAEEAGVSHYMLLHGIRQGILNLFAAALFHLFEQQAVMFLRIELLSLKGDIESRLFSMAEFKKQLAERGIDIAKFSSWLKLDELRLVANTVKHAEGDSAQKLRAKRPDLFQHPWLKGRFDLFSGASTRPAFLPLAGQDIYISLADIKDYRNAILTFWREFGEALATS